MLSVIIGLQFLTRKGLPSSFIITNIKVVQSEDVQKTGTEFYHSQIFIGQATVHPSRIALLVIIFGNEFPCVINLDLYDDKHF